MAAGEYLRLRALGADHGDCLVIEYGDAERSFGVLIDGGTSGTVERVRDILTDRPGVTWELLVVSHVDHDHIGGVLELLTDASLAQRFQDIWFNGRHHLEPTSQESLSIEEGIALAKRLADDKLPWNRAFGGEAVRLSDEGRPVKKCLDSGAKVTVVSPGLKQLRSLANLWDREVARLAAKKAAEDAAREEAAKALANPVPDGLEALSAEGDGPLDIARLAAASTKLDGSAKNGSSIAFIFEFRGRSLLLTGDAHAPVLVTAAASLPEGVSASVEVLKLPHHGSAKNVTKALLKAFPAKSYVVSTNGALHDHPDYEAIARVIHVCPKAQVFFNYDSIRAQRWLAESKSDGRTFEVVVGSDDDGVVVEVLP